MLKFYQHLRIPEEYPLGPIGIIETEIYQMQRIIEPALFFNSYKKKRV